MANSAESGQSLRSRPARELETQLEELAAEPLAPAVARAVEQAIASVHAEIHRDVERRAESVGLLADRSRAARMAEAHACHSYRALLGSGADATTVTSREAGALHFHRGIDLESMIAAFGLLLIRTLRQALSAIPASSHEAAAGSLVARGIHEILRFSAGYVAAMREEQREITEQLRDLAFRDPLTGLANRRLFEEHLLLALKSARRQGHRVGLLRLDVDHFKSLNDSYGHEAGDLVLVEFARRLRGCVRESDLAARVGGDEFAVLLPAVGTADELARIADRIIRATRVPVPWRGGVLEFGVSAGGTMSNGDVDADVLLRAADRALYRVKSGERGRYAFRRADPEHNRPSDLLSDFARALDGGQIEFHYQPQVALATGAVIGIEALLRFRSPPLSQIRPDVVLRSVQASRLLGRFTAYSCQRIADDMHVLAASTPFRGIVAINLSQAQIHSGGALRDVLRLRRQLQKLGMALEVEVTEDVFGGTDVSVIAHTIRRIRNGGIHLALDDFGTGYASLSHLRIVPVNRLKIDRQFVRDIGTSGIARSIVKAILELARQASATVVAEGVETAEQATLLERYGCEAAQGFLFAKAMPLAGLLAWLRDWQEKGERTSWHVAGYGFLPAALAAGAVSPSTSSPL
ncbi:putative signaling protein [bacterium HR40]|nr:putative signaling protein [bacterium HR40]